MKKSDQKEMNTLVEAAWLEASKEVELELWGKFRTCSASVQETDSYYFLRSYDTIVAFIDKATDTLYDMLRLQWGYTATSAQHISKFAHDFGGDKWGCKKTLTWRAC